MGRKECSAPGCRCRDGLEIVQGEHERLCQRLLSDRFGFHSWSRKPDWRDQKEQTYLCAEHFPPELHDHVPPGTKVVRITESHQFIFGEVRDLALILAQGLPQHPLLSNVRHTAWVYEVVWAGGRVERMAGADVASAATLAQSVEAAAAASVAEATAEAARAQDAARKRAARKCEAARAAAPVDTTGLNLGGGSIKQRVKYVFHRSDAAEAPWLRSFLPREPIEAHVIESYPSYPSDSSHALWSAATKPRLSLSSPSTLWGCRSPPLAAGSATELSMSASSSERCRALRGAAADRPRGGWRLLPRVDVVREPHAALVAAQPRLDCALRDRAVARARRTAAAPMPPPPAAPPPAAPMPPAPAASPPAAPMLPPPAAPPPAAPRPPAPTARAAGGAEAAGAPRAPMPPPYVYPRMPPPYVYPGMAPPAYGKTNAPPAPVYPRYAPPPAYPGCPQCPGYPNPGGPPAAYPPPPR